MSPREKAERAFFGENYAPDGVVSASAVPSAGGPVRIGLGASVARPLVSTSMVDQIKPVAGGHDLNGRRADDPLWGLPHSKCSCGACVDWRARHAHKIGLLQ